MCEPDSRPWWYHTPYREQITERVVQALYKASLQPEHKGLTVKALSLAIERHRYRGLDNDTLLNKILRPLETEGLVKRDRRRGRRWVLVWGPKARSLVPRAIKQVPDSELEEAILGQLQFASDDGLHTMPLRQAVEEDLNLKVQGLDRENATRIRSLLDSLLASGMVCRTGEYEQLRWHLG